jgi:glucokinase
VNFVAAIDVGGTAIKSTLVNSELEIMDSVSVPTPKGDSSGKETVATVRKIVAKFNELHPITAVGFAVPGSLDETNGISRWTGNLGWHDLPIRDLLQAELNIPVAFNHDVRAGMVAELRSGAARGYSNSVFIAIGTGIAAALVIDGAIRSSDGYAGELGHIDVGHGGPCVCGKHGCLEAISSALAIANTYTATTGEVKSTQAIFELAYIGDEISRTICIEAIHYLAVACEMLITILAPEIIIFGGGVSNSYSLLIEQLQSELTQRLTFQRMPKLEIAHYGASAGTIGCAMLALDLVSA